MTQAAGAEIERLLRELTPQVLGALMRRFRDFAAAEDAVQEALIAAAAQWPKDGVPEYPRAWLIQVASRRITDEVRSNSARRRRESEAAAASMQAGYVIPEADASEDGDDTLTLIQMCCHPALSTPSAIALTLRAVGGLTTAEIAHAFLVPEVTMAQRISRAKQTIRQSAVPFGLTGSEDRTRRLHAVLHVLYLIFNEGYAASAGENLERTDLASEAIRLARALQASLPGHAEAAGLLALMLLTDARRLARTGRDGEMIPLDKQDRALWDRHQIAEGVALLSATLPKGAVGPYQVQAAIAAVHDEATRVEDTDWPQILALYELLRHMSDNPMVRLSHAVAAAMVHGAARGLELLDSLDSDPRLSVHHRLQAARAHLLELAGDHAGALKHYRSAAGKTGSLPERHYLLMQAARLAERHL